MPSPMFTQAAAASEPAPLNDVLFRVAGELGRMAREGDRLQACIGALALRSGDPALACDLQSIDSLVQHLEGLAGFLTALASGAPPRARVDIRSALDRMPLDALARGLAGAAPARNSAPAGVLELL